MCDIVVFPGHTHLNPCHIEQRSHGAPPPPPPPSKKEKKKKKKIAERRCARSTIVSISTATQWHRPC